MKSSSPLHFLLKNCCLDDVVIINCEVHYEQNNSPKIWGVLTVIDTVADTKMSIYLSVLQFVLCCFKGVRISNHTVTQIQEINQEKGDASPLRIFKMRTASVLENVNLLTNSK